MSIFCRIQLTTIALWIGLLLPASSIASNDRDFSPEARKKLAWSIALGGYFPTVSGWYTAKAGFDSWTTYRFPVGNFDFRVNEHNQSFSLTGANGYGSIQSLTTEGFDALYRLNAFYFRPGISFVSGTANTLLFPFSRPWTPLGTVTVGFDFTTRIFAEAVYQTPAENPYRGVSVGLGYRF